MSHFFSNVGKLEPRELEWINLGKGNPNYKPFFTDSMNHPCQS